MRGALGEEHGKAFGPLDEGHENCGRGKLRERALGMGKMQVAACQAT